LDRFSHATPALQQALPHWVVPDGHPHLLRFGLMHAVPAWQQQPPHTVCPLAHTPPVGLSDVPLHANLASPRHGRITPPTTVTASAPPNAFSTFRRLVSFAIDLAR
jgi:hypothetical protein